MGGKPDAVNGISHKAGGAFDIIIRVLRDIDSEACKRRTDISQRSPAPAFVYEAPNFC
jgi:hypothetical protein